jgi:hypothetical protein
MPIVREFYHNLFAPFTAEFIIPSGVGIDPTAQNPVAVTGITAATYGGTFSMIGSYPARPIITITITAASSLTVINFTNNGDKITITKTLSPGDVIVINCDNKKVTYNGLEIDYDGIFPRCVIGVAANAYNIALTRTSATFNLSVSYNPTYL